MTTTEQTTTLPRPAWCTVDHSDHPPRGGFHAGHVGERIGGRLGDGRPGTGVGMNRFLADGPECWPVIICGGASLTRDEARPRRPGPGEAADRPG
jgi:hypothetical protein